MRTAAVVLAALFAASPVVEPETPSLTREQALKRLTIEKRKRTI